MSRYYVRWHGLWKCYGTTDWTMVFYVFVLEKGKENNWVRISHARVTPPTGRSRDEKRREEKRLCNGDWKSCSVSGIRWIQKKLFRPTYTSDLWHLLPAWVDGSRSHARTHARMHILNLFVNLTTPLTKNLRGQMLIHIWFFLTFQQA